MIPRQILDNDVIRVLLIAPDGTDHALVARLAGESRHCTHTVDWVDSHEAASSAIEAQNHDVYLVHNDLGSHRGLDLVEEMVSADIAAPFIVLTQAGEYQLDIEALEAGATDHLAIQGLDTRTLERAIRHALIHAQARAEFVAAKDEAEAATRAKTKYLANVSHDIRTPLNTIIGMTEIVLRSPIPAATQESLETVLVAAESLQDLADRLSDVGRIVSGEIELHPAPFIIRDAISDVVRIFGLRAQQKGLDIRITIPPHVPETIVADCNRIQQVLIDLVSNAVKYTERGHIEIEVEGVRDRDGHTLLTIAVEDTGVGIPTDLQSTIFERSAAATTDSDSSTGLGVIQQVVTAMGGTISIRSKVGRGSRFTFSVVAEPSEEAEAAGEKPSNGKVLVMSTSPDERRAIEADLVGGGFEPLVVGDIGAAANAATEAAQSGQPLDAIVLDTAYKPFEVARSLTDLAGGSTPVTLLVPATLLGGDPRSRETGVKGLVGKPMSPGILVDVVKATIAASRAGDTDTVFTGDSLGTSRPEMSILVVDDVETNLMLTVRMLTERGHKTTAVRNGIEALDAFEEERFDAVLMDLQMPGLDGFDATAAMRAEEVLQGIPRTPIIALTGHTTAEERDRCIAAGMDGFLSKPIRPDALFAAVEQFAAAAAA